MQHGDVWQSNESGGLQKQEECIATLTAPPMGRAQSSSRLHRSRTPIKRLDAVAQVTLSAYDLRFKVNWLLFKGRWYLISPLPLHDEFKLTVPGERTCIILDRRQMERAVRESLAFSDSPYVPGMPQR